MTKGQQGRVLSDLLLGIGFLLTFMVGLGLVVAVPPVLDPFAIRPALLGASTLLGGLAGMLVGFAAMFRIWRAARDQEPEAYQTWRYRSR